MSDEKTSQSDIPAGVQPDIERMDPRLLELLVCPVTKGTLSYDANAQELISRQAHLAFPIKNGVPLMTLDAARHLDAPLPAAKE